MNWPLPLDFNEAVQNPVTAFADPDLKTGQTIVGPTGLPLPRSGNFADVYQVRGADGRDWAVKCFTRPVTGLDRRYAKVEAALARAGLPFTIGFTFQNEGVRVRGKWYPALKMEWVDGLLVNQVAREQAGNPKVLDALGLMWSRLCKRLREAGVAHADLQHGNVLLVPGSRPGAYGLKLIDYDGMYVPALANSPSGEIGHPNYQHPARAAKLVYSPDLDRFPHLVIATAFKALAVLGPSLWDRFDTGDNLLFTEDDFRNPAASPLMRELWQNGHPQLQALVGHLAVACGKPVPQTPWLDQIAPDGTPLPLTSEQNRAAAVALGFAPAVVPSPSEPVRLDAGHAPPAPAGQGSAFAEITAEAEDPGERPAKSWTRYAIPFLVGFVVLGGALAAVKLLGGKKPDETVQNTPDAGSGNSTDTNKGGDPTPPKTDETPKPPESGPTRPDKVVPPNPPAVSPDPPVLAANVWPTAIDRKVTNVPALTPRWEQTYTKAVEFLTPTPDGAWLVAQETGAMPRVYAAGSGNSMSGYSDHPTSPVGCVALADGNVVSWARDEPFAIVWNAATGKAVGKIAASADTPPPQAGPMLFHVSADGRYVVTGYAAPAGTATKDFGAARVVDTKTGREVVKLQVVAPKFTFTPDGRFLVADLDRLRWFKPDGSADGEVPVSTERRGRVLGASADGGRVLISTGVHSVFLFDSRGGNKPLEFPTPYLGYAGAISADGRTAALVAVAAPTAADRTGSLEIIDLAAGRVVSRVSTNNTNPASDTRQLQFLPDGKGVVVGRIGPGRVQVVDVPDGLVAAAPVPSPLTAKVRWSADVPPDSPTFFEWFPDGSAVVRTGLTGAGGFDARTGRALPSPGYDLSKGTAYPPMPLRNGRGGVYNPADHTVMMWEVSSGTPEGTLALPELPPFTGEFSRLVRVSRNERYVVAVPFPAAVMTNGKPTVPLSPFQVYDTTAKKAVVTTDWRRGSVHFTANSARVLVAEADGRFRWFKLPDGEPDGDWNLGSPTDNPTANTVLGVSANGGVILYRGHVKGEQGLHALDGTTGAVIRSFGSTGAGGECALSPDGKVVAVGKSGAGPNRAETTLYDVATGSVVAKADYERHPQKPAVALGIEPENKAFFVYQPALGKLTVYDIPDPQLAAKTEPTKPIPRAAVPDDAATAKAAEALRELLKDEYAKKTPAARLSLAKKLVELAAGTTEDPAARFVMLRDAKDFATEALDPAVAVQAAEAMAKDYEVEEATLKLATLEKILSATVNAPALKGVMEQALAAWDDAIAADEYETAVKFAQVAASAARKGNVAGGAVQEADGRAAQARKYAEAFAAVKDAVEKLKTAPDDPAANLAVGKYRVFTQNQWEDGLKLIAKGGNAALKALAEQDLAAPRTGAVDVAVPDGWWDYAQTAEDPEKRVAEARARHWYARALPSLSGLAKVKAETRLAFTLNGVEYRPGLLAEFTATANPQVLKGIKARIESTIEYDPAEFNSNGRQTDVRAKWTGIVVPPRAGRYKLVAKLISPVPVKVSVNGRVVFDSGKDKKTEGVVVLPAKPATIAVEYTSPNRPKNRLGLYWVAPGSATEELIPAEVLFHDKKVESAVGK